MMEKLQIQLHPLSHRTKPTTILILLFSNLLIFSSTLTPNELVVIRELPTAPIFYTSYFPMVLTFKVPSIQEDDLWVKFPRGHNIDCNSSATYSENIEGASCPVFHHYQTFISNFLKRLWNNPTGAGSMGPPSSISCDEIQPHFGVHNSTTSWDNYYRILSSCSTRKFLKIPFPSQTQTGGGGDRSSTPPNQELEEMLRNFWNIYVQPYSSSYPLLANAMYTNSYSSLQAAGLLDILAETSKWAGVASSCSSQRLPNGLVSRDQLIRLIRQASAQLFDTSFELSSKVAESYFRLPIVDCSFAEDGTGTTLVMRSLLPIRPKNSSFKLIQLQPIPLAKDFNISSKFNRVCGVEVGNWKGDFALDSFTGFIEAAAPDCSSGELCHMKQFEEHRNDECLQALITESDDAVEVCKISCSLVPTEKFPLIRRLRGDTFGIVGHSSEDHETFLSCNGKPYKRIRTTENGAVLVRLSCNCSYLVHKLQEFHIQGECGENFEIWGAGAIYSIPEGALKLEKYEVKLCFNDTEIGVGSIGGGGGMGIPFEKHAVTVAIAISTISFLLNVLVICYLLKRRWRGRSSKYFETVAFTNNRGDVDDVDVDVDSVS